MEHGILVTCGDSQWAVGLLGWGGSVTVLPFFSNKGIYYDHPILSKTPITGRRISLANNRNIRRSTGRKSTLWLNVGFPGDSFLGFAYTSQSAARSMAEPEQSQVPITLTAAQRKQIRAAQDSMKQAYLS